MAFKTKSETALESARTALAQSNKTDADIKDRRSAAFLAGADDKQILVFDQELVELERVRKVQRDRIALFEREVAREEVERLAKTRAKHTANVEVELDKLSELAARMQKHLGAAIDCYREWQEQGLKIATIQPWPHGTNEAAGFIPGEVLRLVRYEIARRGAGKIMSLGAVKRPDFPGALVPSMDVEHQREKIPSITDAVAERVAYAKKILHGKPIVERKAS